MKRYFLVFLLLILVLLPHALFGFDFALGGKLGLNIGWITGDDWQAELDFWDDYGSADASMVRLGVSAGLFLTFGLVDNLAIQPEVLISTIGGTYSYNYSGYDINGVHSSTVIEIPVHLKPRFRVGFGHVYVLAGPEIMIILGDIRLEESVSGSSAEVDWEVEPDNSALFGISAGLGLDFPMVFGGVFSAELRYSRTFTEWFDDYESFQNAVIIMIGYGFQL